MLNAHGSETKIIEMVEIKNNLSNNSDGDISDLTDSNLSDFLSYDFSDLDSYFDSLYHDNFVAYAEMYCANKITDEMSSFSKASTKVILRYPYNKKS
jgi:hypothetical protein